MWQRGERGYASHGGCEDEIHVAAYSAACLSRGNELMQPRLARRGIGWQRGERRWYASHGGCEDDIRVAAQSVARHIRGKELIWMPDLEIHGTCRY